MKAFLRLFLCLSLFGLVGCASVQHRKDVGISKGVYATQAAIEEGRFDLAKEYADQTARLVPPPKHPVEVKPFISNSQQFTVLPKELPTASVIAQDSPEYSQKVQASKPLQKQIQDEGKQVGKFSGSVDGVLRDESKETAKEPSILSRILKWFFRLSPLFLIAGIICLCVFCPEAIPFVWATLRFALHILKALLGKLVAGLEALESKLEGKGTGPSG